MRTVRELALVRAGDKGDTSNVVVAAESEGAYECLEADLTTERVYRRFEHLGADDVTRYEVPSMNALNFVIRGVLAGGVTTSLRVDSHGKSLSYLLAGMEVSNDMLGSGDRRDRVTNKSSLSEDNDQQAPN